VITADVPPGKDAFLEALDRVTVVVSDLMEGLTGGEPAIVELMTNVDICLSGLDVLPVRHYMVLHNLGVACRQLALRGHAEYGEVSVQLLSAAVDLVYEDVAQTGKLGDLLMIVDTYLRAVLSVGAGYGAVDRANDLLDFASRSRDPRLNEELFSGWVQLAVIHLVQSRTRASGSNVRRLEFAAAALAAAEKLKPTARLGTGPDSVAAGFFVVAQLLVRACRAPDRATAKDAFQELVLSRADIDAAFDAEGTDPGEWRHAALSCATGSYASAPEVLCHFATTLMEADGHLQRLSEIVRRNQKITHDDFAELVRDPRWLTPAWEHVITFLVPLMRSRLSSAVGSSEERRLTDEADLAAQLARVFIEVAAETGLPASMVMLVWDFMSRDPVLASTDLGKRWGTWFRIGVPIGFVAAMSKEFLGFPTLARAVFCYARLLNLLARARLLRAVPTALDRGVGMARLARLVIDERKGFNTDALIDSTITSTEKASPGPRKLDICELMLSWHSHGSLPLNPVQLDRLIRASSSALACPIDRANRDWVSAYRRLLLTMYETTYEMKADFPRDLITREYGLCLDQAAQQASAAPWLSRFLAAVAVIGAPMTADLRAAHLAFACARSDGTAALVSDAGVHFMMVWHAAGCPGTEGPIAEDLACSWRQLSVEALSTQHADTSRMLVLMRCLAAGKVVAELGIDSDEEYRLCVGALDRAAGVLPASENSIMAVFDNVFSAGMRSERDSEALAHVARAWLAVYRDVNSDDWIGLGVNYCGYFRNIDDPAISTLTERYSLLEEMRAQPSGSQQDHPAGYHLYVLYLTCETLSQMGHYTAALRLYGEVQDKLSRSHGIGDGLRWEINHNHVRNELFVAVINENPPAAKAAYARLRALGPNPAAERDAGVSTLSTKATTLSAILVVVPFHELRNEVAEVLAEALSLDDRQLSHLGSGSLGLARLAVAMLEDPGEPDPDLSRLLRACRAKAAEIAAREEWAAVHLRELDLYAALASGDTAAARDGFLSIVAHNDLGLLKAQTMPDLLSRRGSDRALLEAIDRIAADGQFGLAAWLLDQVPCRAVRLAITRESQATAEEFRWDESTWPSILGYAAHPSTGDGTDIVVRFWVYSGSLQLLVGSSELLTIPGFAELSMASTVLGDDAIRRLPAQRTVVTAGEMKRTAETLAQALGRLTDEAATSGARLVTVDFSGHAAALPMVHEALRCCRDRAARPMPAHIITRPGTRNKPPALRRWTTGTITHLGDWSGTLAGPWIEAAYAQAIFGDSARILYPGTPNWPTEDTEDEHAELLIVSSHGYYANESGGGFGRLSFGSVSVGVHETIDGKFGSPRAAMLASCEVGRSWNSIDQQNGMSLPAVLLHKGVEQVTSPVAPVDDMASCVLVTRTLHALSEGAEAPDAAPMALDTIRNWSEPEVTSWGYKIMALYAASPISREAPWPLERVQRHAANRFEAIRGRLPEMLSAYVVTSW
jgi:hypothetical protein